MTFHTASCDVSHGESTDVFHSKSAELSHGKPTSYRAFLGVMGKNPFGA